MLRRLQKRIDCFSIHTEKNRASIGVENFRKLLDFIDGVKIRISRVDLEARNEPSAKGVTKNKGHCKT